MVIVCRAALVAAFLLGPGTVAAHPHVFIEHAVTVTFDGEGPRAVRFSWTFDELFSSMILQHFDTDRSGTFSAAEVRAIEEQHFGNLKEYGYFVALTADGRPLPVDRIADFGVSSTKTQVTYAFTVPVRVSNPARGALEIQVADPTFYTAFFPRPGIAVHVEAPRHWNVTCALAAEGGGPGADVVRCTWRRSG